MILVLLTSNVDSYPSFLSERLEFVLLKIISFKEIYEIAVGVEDLYFSN